MTRLASAIASAALLGLAACQGRTEVEIHTTGSSQNTTPVIGGGSKTSASSSTPPGPHCQSGNSYIGFAGNDLTADRLDENAGVDRDVLKPYSALLGEYPRSLGNTPSLLAPMASTFATPPARWFAVQQSNAISLYAALRISFQGCLTLTANDAQYTTAPDGNSAVSTCSQWEQTFWNRTPSNDEVAVCADLAVNQTTTESDPSRRWAYTCAAVLSSAQFLGY
jgi:hypothetical protein